MRPVIILFLLAVLSLSGISFSLADVSNCSVLSSPDTYVLNRSLNGSPNDADPFGDGACMHISSSDVILDCNGYNITGNTSVGNTVGILLNGPFTNVTVKNCPKIWGYDYCMAFSGSNDSFVINNTVRNCSSFALYLGPDSHGFLIANNSAYDNPSFVFYLEVDSTGNTLINNTAGSSSFTGFELEVGSDYNALVNNTACNTIYGFSMYSSFNNLTNNTACNNSGAGFYLAGSSDNNLSGNRATGSPAGFYLESDACNNLLAGNLAYNNTGSGFFIDMPVGIAFTNNTLAGNAAYDNSENGFVLERNANNTLVNDSAYANALSGFYLVYSSNNTLLDCSAHSNSLAGVYVDGSNATLLRGHYYNNSADFLVNTTFAEADTFINVSNIIFDNPSGSFQNFTNLSLNDSVEPNMTYSISWASIPGALPAGYAAFAGKYVNITALDGTPSIDSVAWMWTSGELAGYDASMLRLLKFNASGWSRVNDTPDTSGNTLSLAGMGSFSTFAILQLDGTTVPSVTLNSPADTFMFTPDAMTFSFTAVDNVSAILNCSLYLDSVFSQSNPAVANATPAEFVVTGIGLGSHTWSVDCMNGENNTGTSAMWHFARTTEAAPTRPPAPSETLNVSLVPGCNGFTVNVTIDGVPVQDAFVSVEGAAPGASAYTGANGLAFFSGCGMDVEAVAVKSGAVGTANGSLQCACPGCSSDSGCPGGEACRNSTCIPAECTSDGQCAEWQQCDKTPGAATGFCKNQTSRPEGGSGLPLSSCTSDEQCLSGQSCGSGGCSNVTGKCGYVANHTWVAYACGPDDGCPACPPGSSCSGHQCVPELNIIAPSTGFVGEAVAVRVMEGAGSCGNCTLNWSLPSGLAGSGNTDANGMMMLPLYEKGLYTITIARNPLKFATVNALSRPAPSEAVPPASVAPQAGPYGGLCAFLLAAIIIGATLYYLRWRDRGKKAFK